MSVTRITAVVLMLMAGGAIRADERAAAAKPATPAPTVEQPRIGEGNWLYEEILAADAKMFSAYNRHEVEPMMAGFAKDVEFYHDKDGLITHEQMTKGFTMLFARNDGLRRDLVDGTFKVYPIGKWGAMSTGEHRFCHQENGKDDCGTFKFLMVWKKSATGAWQVTRAVSYDH
jgi:hypothetical protein